LIFTSQIIRFIVVDPYRYDRPLWYNKYTRTG
jgi:hypothetical protein